MKNIFFNKITFFLLLCLGIMSCVDPYHLETDTFEDAIVIEATLTNELKKQEIKLSRTYRFEENGPTFETGARVFVADDQGTNYEFQELNGRYVSVSEFQAVPGRKYKLTIITSTGNTYSSTDEMLSNVNPIGNVVASATSKDGQEGVQISVNSYDPTGNSKYYRFEYEETYKIVAPYHSDFKAVVVDAETVEVQPRTGGETRICYTTKNSEKATLTSTASFSEDRVTNLPIRFIRKDDYIITSRYSILVKQYIQNLASYTFYKTLQDISNNGSLLSQTQPGFFSGNISSENDPNEKVIGFFDVASVSSQRIFFNFHDIFPGAPFPPYVTDCSFVVLNSLDFSRDPGEGYQLISFINTKQLVYYSNAGPIYTMVAPECGDCTTFSSNIIPEFWID